MFIYGVYWKCDLSLQCMIDMAVVACCLRGCLNVFDTIGYVDLMSVMTSNIS